VFAPISFFSFLLILSSSLPNGIRVAEIPAEGDSAQIVAGYTAAGLTALSTTNAARALELTAYAAGGNVEFFEETGRTGFRITVPQWARPMFADAIAALFREVPKEEANSKRRPDDFRAKVEDEIREALLGYTPQVSEYATDKAFLLMTGPIPENLQRSLEQIPARPSKVQDTAATRLSADRIFRFKPDSPTGAVILAAPVTGIYYKDWYSVLFLDRLMRRVLPVRVTTALWLTLNPYYYRLEVAVPAGQFAETVEDNLLQEIQRLQLTRASTMDLEAARRDARAYLESKYVREWFASQDLSSRREEGIQWISEMTADDMRVAARDLLGTTNRVIASWSPKAKQTSVDVEDLAGNSPVPSSRAGERAGGGPAEGTPAQPVPLAAFPPHTHPPQSRAFPERLASGVSLITGNVNAVFVSGGALTRFDEFNAQTLQAFQRYAPARILVFSPSASMDRARQLWNTFKGANAGDAPAPRGAVSGGDLPALFLLKVMLDRKVIESGWSHEVELRISASDGSALQIQADATKRSQILEWIKRIASEKPSDAEMAWVREVAIHRLDTVRTDLQSLIWERDPQGVLQNLETVGAGHIQDVARIYF
jgi:hypothetical protein